MGRLSAATRGYALGKKPPQVKKPRPLRDAANAAAAAASGDTLAARITMEWPDICERLGWVQKNQATNAVAMPQLVGVERTSPETLHVAFRPQGTIPPEKWDAMCHQLRRSRQVRGGLLQRRVGISAPTVRWTERDTDPGVIDCYLGLQPLEQWYRATSYDHPALQTGDPNLTVIGPQAGGGQAIIDWQRTPHLLVAGETGGGKTTVMRSIAGQCLRAGWWVLAIDPKEEDDWNWLRDLGWPVVTQLDDAGRLLAALVDERRRRAAIKNTGGTIDDPPVLICIDEAPSLINPTRGTTDDLKELIKGLIVDLTELAQKFRSTGGHLMLGAQQPSAKSLGGDTFVRENIRGTIAVGDLSREALGMLGWQTDIDARHPVGNARGRARCSRLNGQDGRDVYVVQPVLIPVEASVGLPRCVTPLPWDLTNDAPGEVADTPAPVVSRKDSQTPGVPECLPPGPAPATLPHVNAHAKIPDRDIRALTALKTIGREAFVTEIGQAAEPPLAKATCQRALVALEKAGLARSVKRAVNGRTVTYWTAT